MKKVLIFTYYWPPAGGIAVQRFLKFSRYLPQHGWQPIIITVNNGSYPNYDESLLKDIPESLRVYKTKTFEPFEIYNLLRGQKGKSVPNVAAGDVQNKSLFQKLAEFIRANLFIPDARVGWVKYAVAQAEEILANEQIDAIITTGPPHSCHLIGLRLKQKFPNLKWIADLRDPWTAIFYNQFLPRTKRSEKLDEHYETEVLRKADCVTVISSGMKEMFAGKGKRIEVLYNGYDDDKFQTQPQHPVPEKGFLFTYTGNFLATQDVPALWQAFAELREQCPEIKMLIIGRADDKVRQSIQAAGIEDMVVYKDFMPFSEVVSYMWYSHMLLFLLARVTENKLLMTGKVFEYMPTGTELMGIGPVDGSAQEVMELTKRSAMVDYDDKEAMKRRIADAYAYWKQHGTGRKYVGEEYKAFAASAVSGKLSHLLNEITQAH